MIHLSFINTQHLHNIIVALKKILLCLDHRLVDYVRDTGRRQLTARRGAHQREEETARVRLETSRALRHTKQRESNNDRSRDSASADAHLTAAPSPCLCRGPVHGDSKQRAA